MALLTCASITHAQDYRNFNTQDMAQHADIGGYNTYHNTLRANKSPYAQRSVYDAPDHFPQPLLGTMIQPNGREMPPHHLRLNIKTPDIPLSQLETFYQKQTDNKQLHQFGYDLFSPEKNPPHITNTTTDQAKEETPRTEPMGAIADNYHLQVGDELIFTLTGEHKSRETVKIGSDGQIIVRNLPPMSATGRTLGALKLELKILLERMNYQGDAFVSVAGIRQIGVLVAGHVFKPGRHNLNAFHSILDALQLAGGIRKTGSLRQIKLIRQGKTQSIDLYQLLMSGRTPPKLTLHDGDRIIVPPIGPTIVVTGDIKQPGIFELKPDLKLAWRNPGGETAHKITLHQALQMAGNVLSAGDNRFTLKSPNTTGNPKILNIGKSTKAMIGDGGILTVTRTQDRLNNAVELAGYSRKNGVYDLHGAGTLSALLGDRSAFGEDVYPLIGVISRIKPKRLTRQLMGFSPQSIAMRQDDRQLENGDKIYLFSHDDVRLIKNETKKSSNPDSGKIKQPVRNTRDLYKNREAMDKLRQNFPRLVRDFVRDSSVSIQGAVRAPGAWPIGSQADLQSIIEVAGGLTRRASRANIEIVSHDRGHNTSETRKQINAHRLKAGAFLLQPGDQIRVNELFKNAVNKSVKITGEIRSPGTYELMRGDTLSSLIKRAGGLTRDAFPPGAVFSRASERKREQSKFHAAALDLERTVSVNMNASDKGATLTPQQIAMAQDLARDLRNMKAVGRITVEADLAVLSDRPELDLLLEGGDHIYIPKRPMNIRVSGEVLSSASLLFERDKSAHDYINEAGGLTYYADKSRIFVIYPDGAAQPLRSGGWSGRKPVMIIPGSTIIVPRDPKPFNFMDSFKDITQIMTNMAITTVFIDDVVSDD